MQERKGDSFLIFVSLTQLYKKSLVFVDKTNSNIALRVFRHFFLPQFVKDAWLWAWVIHAEHICAMWLAVVQSPLGICGLKNNWRRITYGIGCVRRMPSPSPLSSLVFCYNRVLILGKRNDLPFLRKSDSREKYGFLHACAEYYLQLDGIAHEQTIICRQLFARHVVGSRPMKRKKNLLRMTIAFIVKEHKRYKRKKVINS